MISIQASSQDAVKADEVPTRLAGSRLVLPLAAAVPLNKEATLAETGVSVPQVRRTPTAAAGRHWYCRRGPAPAGRVVAGTHLWLVFALPLVVLGLPPP